MNDTLTEGYFENGVRIRRIAAEAKRLANLPHDERLAELHRLAKRQQKRNCQFCKKCPEKCK